MTIKTVCVYCSSSKKIDEAYMKEAESVATTLVHKGYDFIYGGGKIGLMGVVAETALREGAKVTGVFIKHLEDRECQQDGLTELFVAPTMNTRKAIMFEKADAFLVLPGGFGTLDEVFEVLTLKQIGIHKKPIIFYNQNNFWDPAFRLMEHVVNEGFAPSNNKLIYKVAYSPEEVVNLLQEPEDITDYAVGKWS